MKIEPNKILEGFRNAIIPPKDLEDLIEQVAEERRAICLNCPFNSTCGKITLTSYCKACGCNLKAKTKCLSCECGIKNYNEVNPQAKLEVLWTSVTTHEENTKIQEQIKNEKPEL